MTPEEFIKRQKALGYSNQDMASILRKTPQSITNYRSGRQAIPAHVDALISHEEAKQRDSA